jgi:hypothetical protein
MLKQLKISFYIVWIIISIITGLILISPFILSRGDIENIAPKCEWKVKYGRECFFCGMTNGFIDISNGKFEDATKRNKFSIYMYSMFLLNEIVFLFIIIRNKFQIKGLKA